MTKTKSEITGKQIDFSIKHVGLFVDDNLWQHDKWIVLFNGGEFTTNYSTGIGHRKPRIGSQCQSEFERIMNANYKKNKQNLIHVNNTIEKNSLPVAPKLDDVLYSLVIDSEAENMSFSDWCSNFGYDDDSMKANKIYNACSQNADILRKIGFSDLEELQSQFSDY